MNKIKIYNQYAMEQGYESWRELTNSYGLDGQITTSEYLDHQNKVTDLIQEELKKKIKKCVKLKVFDGEKRRYGKEFEMNKVIVKVSSKSILNTEIL